jgi:RNA polymerase primary sigma factor
MKKQPVIHDDVALTDELLAHEELDLEVESDEPDRDELVEEDSFGGEVTGDDDRIDDPVRIYLMQMGEIPLLTAKEELISAKRIEIGRLRFRHCMLANDYVLQAAVGLLENIRDNKVRLDRTIEVSVINVREKRRLLRFSIRTCIRCTIC